MTHERPVVSRTFAVPSTRLGCISGRRAHSPRRPKTNGTVRRRVFVQPQRPVGAVEVINLDHFVERDSSRAEHLPRTSHTGRQLEPRTPPALDPAVLVEHERPGADEGHVTAQNVDQLRQLVEGDLPQASADPGDSWIVLDLEEPILRLVVRRSSNRSSAPSAIVRNLSISNGTPLRPMRAAGTAPGRESSLIAIAIAASSGESTSRPAPAPTMSKARLTAFEEWLRPKRRIPSSVMPSTSSSSTDEPTTSGSRGSTLTRSPIAFRLRVVFRRSSETAPWGRGSPVPPAVP